MENENGKDNILGKPENAGLITEFRRSLNHNYLIIKNSVSEEINHFSLQMITENRIPSLLDMDVKDENGEKELYYEISSLQSLSRVYEIKKITGEELAEMIRNIVEVFQRIKEYMLTEEEVVMLPEYIFMNPETRQMRFMYCPYVRQNCGNLFWELAEFFLDHVEHQDSEAVLLAYQFYKIVRSESYVLQEIQQLCEKQFEHKSWEEKREGSQEIRSKDNYHRIAANEIREKEICYKATEYNGNFKEDTYMEPPNAFPMKRRKSSREKANKTTDSGNTKLQFVIFIIITGISFILVFKNSNPVNSYSKIISIGFLLFGLGGAVISLLKSKAIAKESKESKETEIDIVKEVSQIAGNEAADGPKERYEVSKKNAPRMTDHLPIKESGFYQQQNETVYGKTEFCLITPEEEERVLVEKRHGKEIRHKIDTLPFTIGKLKEMSDLYLSDNTVSRLHARIFEEEGKLYILDLGSTNGTYLNGISINQEEKFLLEAGDELRIGKTEFVYQ